MNKKKKKISDDVVTAMHIGGREEQRERNGDLQFVAVHRVHKSKKTYDRKRDKKVSPSDFGGDFFMFSYDMRIC